jgi:hypothetical protein
MNYTGKQPQFITFNHVYQTLVLLKFAGALNMKVTLDDFTFTAKFERQHLHLKVERGNDSVGGSIPLAHPTIAEIFEIELDLFMMFAQEWHTANPVMEREQVSRQYQAERRLARQAE